MVALNIRAQNPHGRFYAEDRLVGLDPGFLDTRAELIGGPDNAIGWLRFGSRIHCRLG